MSALDCVSDTFDPSRWREVDGFTLTDMTYHRGISRGPEDGAPTGTDLPVVRIAFERPEIRNAFRPHTVDELYRCLDHARMTSDVAAVIVTGNGPSPRDGGYSFCSGGDQRIAARTGIAMKLTGVRPRHRLSSAESRLIRRARVVCIFWKCSALFVPCPKL